MFTTLRKHQRWLMLVIAVLTVVAFAFLYNTTDLDRVGMNKVAKIYGRDVMRVDVEKGFRNYQLAAALGQVQLIRELAGRAQTEDQAATNFIWNLMILKHESEALGVDPGDKAVEDKIKSLPIFQTGDQFDPTRYVAFIQDQLAPRGFTARQLQEVIKDTLRLEGVKRLVESPAVVTPEELKPALARMSATDIEVIHFDTAAAAKKVAASEEELRQAFEARKASLQAPEKRSVRYVTFALSPAQKALKDKARVDALQKLSTATGAFGEKLADRKQTLAAAAKDEGLQVRTTPPFTAEGEATGKLEGQDQELVAAAADAVFRLPQGGFEMVPLGDDGYAVVEVAEVEAARPLTFEEARADLLAAILEAKAQKAAQEEASKVLPALREQLAAGKTFAEAAKALGLKTTPVKGLSVFDDQLDLEKRRLAMVAMDVETGGVSDFGVMPQSSEGIAVYVAGRTEPDAAAIAQRRPVLEAGVLQGKKMLLFAQWLQSARQASGLQMLRPM